LIGNKVAKYADNWEYRIKQFYDSHNVIMFFPPEDDEQSSVLLVYDPSSPSASPSPVEKAKNIEEVENELLKFARDAADVKSQTISVEKKWHEAVVGKGGTTLNAWVLDPDLFLTVIYGHTHVLCHQSNWRGKDAFD